MQTDRYIVSGFPPVDRPLAEPKEQLCNSEVAARLHAAAFTIDGYKPSIWDCVANKTIALSGQKETLQ